MTRTDDTAHHIEPSTHKVARSPDDRRSAREGIHDRILAEASRAEYLLIWGKDGRGKRDDEMVDHTSAGLAASTARWA
jgi:hypothetical protein